MGRATCYDTNYGGGDASFVLFEDKPLVENHNITVGDKRKREAEASLNMHCRF
jgi:hypothetical protein